MSGKFELKKTASGQFMFNLKAGNGQVILTSESYTAKAGAQNGIESVRKNSQVDAQFDRRTSSKGDPYFVLLAANKQVIGRSEMYSSNAAMENGIASVKANGATPNVDDQS